MSVEKMREEFEAAVLRDWPQAPLRICPSVSSRAGQYAEEAVQRAWWGWQASRAAIEVDWPDHYEYTNSDVAGAAILDCRTAFGKVMKS